MVGTVREHEATLRQLGLLVTAQRLAVLRAVAAQPHSTADDVANAVREGLGAVSRQTVYDALDTVERDAVAAASLLAFQA